MEALERLLDVVRRDLEASRAALEFSTAYQEDASSVYVPLRDGWQLRVDFDTPVQNTEAKREQLRVLARSFDRVLNDALDIAPTPQQATSRSATEIAHTLDALQQRVGAAAVWVIDDRSPIVWGASEGGRWLTDAEQARALGDAMGDATPEQARAWLDGQQLPPPPASLAQARDAWLEALAEHDDSPSTLVVFAALSRAARSTCALSEPLGQGHVISRPFAAIYRLVAVFDAQFSALHAQATLTRAVPLIERLVTEHPPIDPTPQGARIHAFRPRED